MTSFDVDIQRGRPGEIIFKEDFLDFLGVKYQDVTGCQRFQVIDSDYLTKIGLYEIKNNYKDDKHVIIEEYSNMNEKLGPISYGWFYKSKADLIISISQKTRTMVFIPLTEAFKQRYKEVKDRYTLIPNNISYKNGEKWQSAFRKISFNDLKGYFSVYKKIT